MDPNFRRLRYCRYADDFLIGLIGSKQDAREVMDAVQDFLATSLNLRVSPEKSGIHHASTGSRFLGYHVCTDASRQTTVMAERSGRDGGTRRVPLRPLTGNVQLRVPRDRIVAFCGRNRYGDLQSRLSRARPWLIHASDLEIVEAYNAELRGFSTYYALAAGVKRSLGLLAYIATHSLMRTLARRHRSSVAKIARKLRAGSDLVVREEGRSRKVWLLKHLDLSPRKWATVDAIDVRATIPSRRDDPIGRLHARICEACGGTDGPFEMHHSQTLADMRDDLRDLPVLPPRWRKTLVLCRTCREVRHRQ